jgi:hypothetical protein
VTGAKILQSLGLLALWRDLSGNRRLQWGLLAVLVILGAEGGLRWMDTLGMQERKLAQLRDQKIRLREQVRDHTMLEALLDEAERLQAAAKARLWVVPSEAVGQARQKDWVQTLFQTEGVRLQTLVLATPRANLADAAARPADIREFRATLTFPFSPDNLEKVLAAIEAGPAFARVEGLRVNRRQRRIEIEFAMAMEIDPAGAPVPPVAEEASVAARGVELPATTE